MLSVFSEWACFILNTYFEVGVSHFEYVLSWMCLVQNACFEEGMSYIVNLILKWAYPIVYICFEVRVYLNTCFEVGI